MPAIGFLFYLFRMVDIKKSKIGITNILETFICGVREFCSEIGPFIKIIHVVIPSCSSKNIVIQYSMRHKIYEIQIKQHTLPYRQKNQPHNRVYIQKQHNIYDKKRVFLVSVFFFKKITLV